MKPHVYISRCHDEEDQGMQIGVPGIAPWTEWQLAADVNDTIRAGLLDANIQTLYLHRGKLRERIAAINYGDRTVGINGDLAVEVHWNSMPGRPSVMGHRVLCWFRSDKGICCAKCIEEELDKLRPNGMGVCLCSSTRRWVGTRHEYEDEPLAFLQATHVPAVIVEAGFLSSPVDAEWIAKLENRIALGKVIARGITRYVKEVSSGLEKISDD